MKSILTFSALVCAAFATSALAYPTPAEPLFVSRMVKRELVSEDATSSSCGEYALLEPSKLQVRSYNDSATAFLSVSNASSTQILTAIPEASGSQDAYEFGFKTCNSSGFTQAYSRNSGGSMGAPLEFWGRVVTNTTTSPSTATNESTIQEQCLSAIPSQSDNTTGTFELATCNETDTKQWFRLQEGLGGPVVSYFPVQNVTGYVYEGQTPDYFKVDLHPEGSDVNAVEYVTEDSQQYVRFY